MKAILSAVALVSVTLSSAEEAGIEPVPPQRLQTSFEDIIQSRTVDLGERQITFEKIRPLSLPPIPKPPVRPEAEFGSEQHAAIAALKEKHFVFLGVTVYVPEEGPDGAKSLVR